ncbi:MAG: hypothetical protein IKY01_03535 [Prevotella sp.]|nr:hypothetical protein [Prevotella sp.]
MSRRSVYIFLLMVMCCTSASSQDLKLFSPEQREIASRSHVIVMDFLERYFNELPKQKRTTVSTKMADDKVYFRNGQLSDLSQIADTMPFSINLSYPNYEVEWKKQDKPFITIVFPAQYDLLLGMQQEEAQQKFKETILASSHCKDSVVMQMEKDMIEDGIFVSKTGYLELESFNDATYYIYNNVDKAFSPYFNEAHLDYSAANLFHGLIPDADFQMYVEQSVYGLKTINYTISLRQWLDYCVEWGMKVYCGIEEQREDGLLALVIAENQDLGFNHMLSVVIPDKFVSDKNSVLKVRMTPYIPTHNIKNLFQKENINHRKIKWQ